VVVGSRTENSLQFLLLRWYFRLLVWARFLWHVSRIGLALLPTHRDRCGPP
jgi:hypothetical protein